MSVGDHPDFDRVYRAHVGLVWRCLRRAGVPDSMLEDATQEVFLVHHRRSDVPTQSVAAWLVGITRKVASNVRRGEQRFLRRIASQRAEPGAEQNDDPEDRLRRSQALTLVEAFLITLTPALREVFELIEIEGLKQREVAELLGLSINTVGSRLRVGRVQFEDYVRRLDAPEVAHG